MKAIADRHVRGKRRSRMDDSVPNLVTAGVGHHRLETGETCDTRVEQPPAVGETGQPREPYFHATPLGETSSGHVDRPVCRIERIQGGRDDE